MNLLESIFHHRRQLVCALVALTWPLGATAQSTIRMSTTTSTDNSGLLAYLLPAFQAKSGIKVHVIAVGSGKALELAKRGDVDVTLVHARGAEDAFVASGHGVDRRDVMHNDFVLACPASDPARLRGEKDVIAAFRKLASSPVRFISRGDDSGTDIMEKSYWKLAGTMPPAGRYLSSGQGMGEVLTMAAELQACTLTDRATFATFQAKTGLDVMVQGDRRMRNPYGIIAVNPARHAGVNYRGARALIDWITSPEGQTRIGTFRVKGQQLFFPSAPAAP
ncbi:substrate-binding domain-containing protein [Massilia sp. PAMC28688]|uniref:substrate-binding domain-containing protein n=1 Tax=Massilia sp. PAMC28688 TaxID=2861283 RepID=UPI001C633134|nr:substrate-binding domain-containing protein [Massilia sp. PAMC28688]QYF91775.1 substrate-binding domain-containing protein [Massilia sp. PAMC28688]